MAVGAGPVVAVPGLGLTAAVARRLLDRLRRPAGVVELPAFGVPAAAGTALGPRALADRLLAHLDAAEDGPVVLLGHSASCVVVAQVAARRPERVSALVLVGPTTDPRARSWPRLVGRWWRNAVRETPRQVPVLLGAYHRTGLRTMRRGMDALRHDRIAGVLGTVGCPVLVVRGRHDRIAPRDWVESLAAAAPRGRARSVGRGAHMVPLTHPAELAAVVDRFLDDPSAA